MQRSAETYLALYGKGPNQPDAAQWETLLKGDMNAPLTVVTLIKLREQADATLTGNTVMTGQEAFERYVEIALPKFTALGGRFLLQGQVEGGFIGERLSDWDIAAVGEYPRREGFLNLLDDKAYQAAFIYRRAAVAYQHVFLVNAM